MGKSHTCYKISVSKKHMMDKPDHTHILKEQQGLVDIFITINLKTYKLMIDSSHM